MARGSGHAKHKQMEKYINIFYDPLGGWYG
jgi:hypothetical protein